MAARIAVPAVATRIAAAAVAAAFLLAASPASGRRKARARKPTRPSPAPAASASPAPAPAQTPAPVPTARQRARALVVEGARQVRRGDYVRALGLFKQAYALYASPKILFNLAQTYRELDRPVDALDAYERFLREAPKDTSNDLLATARRAVAELKREVATILVQVNVDGARISIDGKEVGLSPMDLPHRTVAGVRQVVVSRKGYVTATERCTVRKGQRLLHTVTLKRFKPTVVVRKVVYRIQRKPRRGLRLFWTGLAVTAALVAGVAVTGSLALYEQQILDDASRSVTRREKAADRGKVYQWVTDGLLIGAGAAAVFTTVWGLVVVRRSGGVERVPVHTWAPPTVLSGFSVLPTGSGLLLEARF